MGLTVNIQTVTGQLCRLGNVLGMQRSCKDTYPSQHNAECALPEHVRAHLSELMVSAESFAFNLMHAYKLPQSVQADAPCTAVIGKSFTSCGVILQVLAHVLMLRRASLTQATAISLLSYPPAKIGASKIGLITMRRSQGKAMEYMCVSRGSSHASTMTMVPAVQPR